MWDFIVEPSLSGKIVDTTSLLQLIYQYWSLTSLQTYRIHIYVVSFQISSSARVYYLFADYSLIV
jgi:hypothetical protein